MAPKETKPVVPFLFPAAESETLPDSSKFFSPHLLSSPLPTSSFFRNFVIDKGDQPSYIHPYLINLSSSSLSLSYPFLSAPCTGSFLCFKPDFTISTSEECRHSISSVSDLGVTVDFPECHIRFWLVRGCPYITFEVSKPSCISFSTKSTIKSLSSCNTALTKHKVELDSKQLWVIYSSSKLTLKKCSGTGIISSAFCGVIRVAVVPKSRPKNEEILDLYSSCYPTSGEVIFATPFCLGYKWEKRGWGELLMLGHTLHLELLSVQNSSTVVLDEFKFRSIDGDLVGIVGDYWKLKVDPVPITWHSIRQVPSEFHAEIISALLKDVNALDSTAISTTNCYSYGKQVSRAARLALIAEEMNCRDVIPAIQKFLKDSIEPWLLGKFEGNGFFYDAKSGGIISKCEGIISKPDVSKKVKISNEEHLYLGYFVFSIAVLSKLDQKWGTKFKPQAYALVASFMSLGNQKNSSYARLTSFDVYKLHNLNSWIGPNLKTPGESVNEYYSATLLGMAYGDDHLMAVGSTLASLEVQATQTWWNVKKEGRRCSNSFGKMLGVGNQVLPLTPITEILFSDNGFVREMVDLALGDLLKADVSNPSKVYVHALEAIYDKASALKRIRNFKYLEEGSSLTNMLWWVHGRGVSEELTRRCRKEGKDCWFCAYCC